MNTLDQLAPPAVAWCLGVTLYLVAMSLVFLSDDAWCRRRPAMAVATYLSGLVIAGVAASLAWMIVRAIVTVLLEYFAAPMLC